MQKMSFPNVKSSSVLWSSVWAFGTLYDGAMVATAWPDSLSHPVLHPHEDSTLTFTVAAVFHEFTQWTLLSTYYVPGLYISLT